MMRSASVDSASRRGGVLDEDGELVAAEAGHGVARRARRSRSRSATCDQQLVAGAVAEAVVDLLEAVEVEEQHRDRASAARGAAQRVLRRRSLNSARLAQPGQRVVERLVDELLLELLALADVAGVEDEAADVRVVAAGS